MNAGAVAPAALTGRYSAAAEYDAQHHAVVMFGGVLANSAITGQTYTWDTPLPVLSKTVADLAAAPAGTDGETVSYALTVTNKDPGTVLSGVQITDPIPAGVTVDLASVRVNGGACTSNPNCTQANGVLTVTGLSVTAPATGPGTSTITYEALLDDSGAAACQVVTNTASAATPALTPVRSTSATATLPVCDGGLGHENWWSFAGLDAAPGTTADVNVANGNLVLQSADSTVVPGQGHLAHGLRRTYNSQAGDTVSLPASWGRGWTLDIGWAGDLPGVGVTPTGLYVPTASSVLNPFGVTLLDRDGTRHVFRWDHTSGGGPCALLAHRGPRHQRVRRCHVRTASRCPHEPVAIRPDLDQLQSKRL
jgi:fimbrial isopeptide formation D2 family protein